MLLAIGRCFWNRWAGDALGSGAGSNLYWLRGFECSPSAWQDMSFPVVVKTTGDKFVMECSPDDEEAIRLYLLNAKVEAGESFGGS